MALRSGCGVLKETMTYRFNPNPSLNLALSLALSLTLTLSLTGYAVLKEMYRSASPLIGTWEI